MIRVVKEPMKSRLRVRRIDPNFAILAKEARQDGWMFRTWDGGTVANAYKYTAETEVVLAVASPHGYVAAWWGRADANKTTGRSRVLGALAGVARGLPCGYPEDWWDLRCGEARRDRARHSLIRLWNDVFPSYAEPSLCLWCVSNVH